MITKEYNHERVTRVLKTKALGETGATFVNISPQFANAEPAMDVRIAEGRAEFEQSEDGTDLFSVGQRAQSFLHEWA